MTEGAQMLVSGRWISSLVIGIGLSATCTANAYSWIRQVVWEDRRVFAENSVLARGMMREEVCSPNCGAIAEQHKTIMRNRFQNHCTARGGVPGVPEFRISLVGNGLFSYLSGKCQGQTINAPDPLQVPQTLTDQMESDATIQTKSYILFRESDGSVRMDRSFSQQCDIGTCDVPTARVNLAASNLMKICQENSGTPKVLMALPAAGPAYYKIIRGRKVPFQFGHARVACYGSTLE